MYVRVWCCVWVPLCVNVCCGGVQGGFMALQAFVASSQLAQPLFKAVVAVAPVTSWAFYDSIYTERYMRTPQTNANGCTCGGFEFLLSRVRR